MGLVRDYFTFQGGNEQGRVTRMLDKADQAIATLEANDANWTTLTAAQKDAANQLAVRVLAKTCRLLLGRLEAE